MAREIEIHQLCDLCLERGERSGVVWSKTISFDGSPPRLLELCAECRDHQIGQLEQIVRDLGLDPASVDRPPADQPERIPCPVCGRQLKRSSMSGHLRERHPGETGSGRCEICDRTFERLRSHQLRSHKGDPRLAQAS